MTTFELPNRTERRQSLRTLKKKGCYYLTNKGKKNLITDLHRENPEFSQKKLQSLTEYIEISKVLTFEKKFMSNLSDSEATTLREKLKNTLTIFSRRTQTIYVLVSLDNNSTGVEKE